MDALQGFGDCIVCGAVAEAVPCGDGTFKYLRCPNGCLCSDKLKNITEAELKIFWSNMQDEEDDNILFNCLRCDQDGRPRELVLRGDASREGVSVQCFSCGNGNNPSKNDPGSRTFFEARHSWNRFQYEIDNLEDFLDCPDCDQLPEIYRDKVKCPRKCISLDVHSEDPLILWNRVVQRIVKVQSYGDVFIPEGECPGHNFQRSQRPVFSKKEGRRLLRIHTKVERSSAVVKAKKAKTPCLSCECCEFNFLKAYGELGRGYIECHHRTPLHTLAEETETNLDDLALVCANCHRMLHRRMKEMLSVEALKEVVVCRI